MAMKRVRESGLVDGVARVHHHVDDWRCVAGRAKRLTTTTTVTTTTTEYRVRDDRDGDLPQRFYHCARAQSVNNNVADVVVVFLFLFLCSSASSITLFLRRRLLPTVNGCEQQPLQQPAYTVKIYDGIPRYDIINLKRVPSASG